MYDKELILFITAGISISVKHKKVTEGYILEYDFIFISKAGTGMIKCEQLAATVVSLSSVRRDCRMVLWNVSNYYQLAQSYILDDVILKVLSFFLWFLKILVDECTKIWSYNDYY